MERQFCEAAITHSKETRGKLSRAVSWKPEKRVLEAGNR